MKILFDFEIDDALERPAGKTNLFFTEVKSFVNARFRLLEDEINSLLDKGDIAIVILSLEGDAFIFYFHNITKRLSDKLLGSINTADFEYLLQVIEKKAKKNDI